MAKGNGFCFAPSTGQADDVTEGNHHNRLAVPLILPLMMMMIRKGQYTSWRTTMSHAFYQVLARQAVKITNTDGHRGIDQDESCLRLLRIQ